MPFKTPTRPPRAVAAGTRVRLVTDHASQSFGALCFPEADNYDGTVPAGTEGTVRGEEWMGHWLVVTLADGRLVPCRAKNIEVIQ